MYTAKHTIVLVKTRISAFPTAWWLDCAHYLSWQPQHLLADHQTTCCKMKGRRQNTEHKQGTARIKGSGAHLMSHLSECDNVTDLHAWVGWGLQHEQLDVPCHQGFLNCPAFHLLMSAFSCLTICVQAFLFTVLLYSDATLLHGSLKPAHAFM